MATLTTAKPDLRAFVEEVRTRAGAQFDSAGYRRILGLPLTTERARRYVLQKAHWNLNRRDCWGFAQGSAPRCAPSARPPTHSSP